MTRWADAAQRVDAIGETIASWLDACRYLAVALLVASFFVFCWGHSLEKPLWNDEWFTIHLARLPSVSALMAALRAGVDSQPPLDYLLTRVAFAAFGDHILTARLVSIAGVGLMMLGFYVVVRRRLGTTYALAAPVLALLASPGSYAAVEARPYGLMLGFAMSAFVCWQAALAGSHRRLALIGLAASLALGMTTHYYMVLMLPPLVAGSLVEAWRTRRIDWGMATALAVGLLPLVPLAPTMRATAGYSVGNWSPASVWTLYDSYGANLLSTFGVLVVGAGGILILSLLLGPSPNTAPAATGSQSGGGRRPLGFTLPEWVAIAALVATPITAFVMGELITGVLHPRYAQLVVLGFVLACVGVAYANSGGRALAGLWLLAIASSTYAVSVAWAGVAVMDGVQRAKVSFANAAPHEPVIYTHPHAFLENVSSVPPEKRWRLVYLADPELSLRYLGQNCADVNIERLATILPLQVFRYQEYVRQHPSFLVVWQDVPQGWLQRHLEREHVKLEWLERLPAGGMLVRVRMDAGDSTPVTSN